MQNGIYIYRVHVVERNLDCVNYLHRSGSTTIGFDGTALAPKRPRVAVPSPVKHCPVTIDAHFEDSLPPTASATST